MILQLPPVPPLFDPFPQLHPSNVDYTIPPPMNLQLPPVPPLFEPCRSYTVPPPMNLSLYCPSLSCSTPCRLFTVPPLKNLSVIRSAFPFILTAFTPSNIPFFYCTRTASDRPSPSSSSQALIIKAPSNIPPSTAPALPLTALLPVHHLFISPNRTFTIATPSFQVT